jgi:hypothetical protein
MPAIVDRVARPGRDEATMPAMLSTTLPRSAFDRALRS